MINSDAMKASAGALSRIPVCREHNLKLVIHYLKASGIRIVGCTEKSKTPARNVSFIEPVCVVMGSEENGISPEYLKLCDETCMLPMAGEIASLNVSVAAGMVLYEASMQRGSE
jgi:23S rRNA (guanosine2251-2'-O)-methyltransferase